MARGQWSEVEARGVLEAWRKSGMLLEPYARQRGLVPQRLRWWRVKLDAVDTRRARVAAPAVLPVRVTADPARRGEPVTVLLRTGHMLKVSHGFDEEAARGDLMFGLPPSVRIYFATELPIKNN